MKPLIKKALIFFLAFSPVLLLRAEGPKIDLIPSGKKSFIVKMDNMTKEADLSIKDLNGFVLYEETISQSNGYAKLFNVSALQEGNYVLEVSGVILKKVCQFKIIGSTVKIDQDSWKEVFKPIFKKNGNNIDMNFFNQSGKKVSIKILNSKGDLIHDEVLKGKTIIARRYQLKNKYPDTYVIHVSVNGNDFRSIIN